MKIHLNSLGCARNQIDGEIMAGLLEKAGWTIVDDPSEAEVIVVNTCGFIEAATQESIDVILELATLKEEGKCRGLIVTGCVPERYKDSLAEQLPEVDFFLGTGAYDRIVEAAGNLMSSENRLFPPPGERPPDDPDLPRKTTLSYSAYLKIAEGCDRKCTYCIIPKLRGRHRSRPLGDIAKEAKRLVAAGARELNLVAQDSSSWGYDFHPPRHPADLLTTLSELAPGSSWIRLLYGHPDRTDDRLVRTMGNTTGVLPYFDIPVQHASVKILRRMGRNYDGEYLFRLFDNIRNTVPEAVLRTTLIVGFPGETQKDFEELAKFVEKVRFDHLGVFVYSDEDDLPSHRLSEHVSGKTATKRRDAIMKIQKRISEKRNEKYIGQTLDILVEEKPEEGVWIGRAWFQAPDVDGVVYVRSSDERFSKGFDCDIGSAARVKIADAMEYDLIGEPE